MKKWYNLNLSVAEIARRANVSYLTAYGYTRLKERNNPETGKLFESLSEYQEYLARQRQGKPENQELSDFIPRKLGELRKNQSWLAEKMGVTRKCVSLYTHGKLIPSEEALGRLFSALQVPYQTLEDLLEDAAPE